MKGRTGTLLIILGELLVLAALAIFAWNQLENRRAGDSADSVMEQISSILEEGDDGTPDARPAEDGFLEEDDLPVVEIDGCGYIGYLSIPSLGLELPVMDEWDYPRLKISPCRYTGSPLTDDFVICAHNYARHFGTIKNLIPADGAEAGAEVSFTAMDGRVWTYEVAYVGVYQPTDVEKMTSGEYGLTLFTCTYGGKTRVAVGCDLVSHSHP